MAEEQNKKPEKVIPLKYPVMHGSEEIKELIIQNRPKAKHFREIPVQNQTMGDSLRLLSKVTGLPRTVIDELDSEDMFNAIMEVQDFLPASLKTGVNL